MRTTAVVLLSSMLLVAAGCSEGKSDDRAEAGSTPPSQTVAKPSASGTSPAPAPVADGDLPRGGRQLFPKYQLVGYVGLPGSPALGPLDKDLDAKADKLEKLAKAYAVGRTPLPVLELIVVVANGSPGKDGKYRNRISDEKIADYLEVARAHKMLLLLDIQPGRAKILDEVKRQERWLKEPDVGLAYDPEWAVGPGQVPGKVFGRTTGAELDSIAQYLSGLVAEHDLPEKAFVFHQLSARIVSNEKALKQHPGVAVIKSVDGIGSRSAKESTWRKLTPGMAPGVHGGFKLFYQEDTRHGPLMTPAEVMALKPRPEFVVYE
ncbi:hypothetical protein [Kribbella sp. CA-293567]|uniref:hypothetical protein n=1 Tax=Kribbella sp. CA-293567 TaxID=3002436 RepID=UPI0022DE3597|nr:hypothetical protein [Kribbella sp. CA-293567]WBQ07402.1 hypothetical protein OX958_11505 [Kribbella sp. CA-293567]